MLRRVTRGELRLGMYVHSLEGAWFDHPFWRTRFLLDDPADLQALRDSNIAAIVIDESKGVSTRPPPTRIGLLDDDADGAAAGTETPPPAEAVKAERPRPRPALRAVPKPAPPPVPCSVEEEVERAAATVDRSKKAIANLLAEVRLGRAADIARALPVVEDITTSLDRNPHALVSISRMRSKDEYTYYHSIAVCALMVNLARQLGFAPAAVREAGLAGLLHDFGKVVVPESVLKKPQALTDFEIALVREHPERGHAALKASGYSQVVLDVCLHHHERIDGTGYPHGLKGDEISLEAKMATVCDVYDAITSRRPYKAAAGPAESLAGMFQSKGHFDEGVLAAFIRSIGIYPVGSLVRLKSDRLGVVVDQDESNTTRPVVRVFYCIKTRARIPAFDLNLAEASDDKVVSREEPIKWGFVAWESQWTAMIRATPRAAANG